ncbi:MAG: type I-C CRISPR-associated protein Cas8c/Csd1 [Gordonibacter sp.]|uniref:type I-C CRISPR-associated protein Cas8c/Csd1 n=1 Tax=Gordonibacter sp. TaxID=1968902 RepID=UPI002FC90570
MILNELHQYYLRLRDSADSPVPSRFWSIEKASWEIEIAQDGRLISVLSLESSGTGDEKARKSIEMSVPEHDGRSGTALKPYFLCDKSDYVLGTGSLRHYEATAALHDEVLSGCDDEGARAVLAFFGRNEQVERLDEDKREALSKGGFAVFRLAGDKRRLHERPAVVEAWNRHCLSGEGGSVIGQCGVTGEQTHLARLFPQVSGVAGAQSSGASLVSFNFDSSESYGKKQAYNASLSEDVAFGAGAALKHLMNDNAHRCRIGDTTVVFWSDRPAYKENEIMRFVMDADALMRPAEDKATIESIESSLMSMKLGMPSPELDYETRFFIMGLAPNAARLSVRFFEVETFGRLADNFGQYLRDIDMVDVKGCSLRTYLLQTAVLGKTDNVPSTLIGSCVTAMLKGGPFPQALYTSLLSRMRCDHASNNPWDMGRRAALVKACLVRKWRCNQNTYDSEGRSLTVSLNENNTHPGYLLGRLFAVMEKAQRDAIPGASATIRDRYIGAASTTPARTFPSLLRNYQNHIENLRKKGSPGYYVTEKRADEIMKLLDGDGPFPKSLDTEEQGMFYVGYYQQRVDLWTKKTKEGEEGAEYSESDEKEQNR